MSDEQNNHDAMVGDGYEAEGCDALEAIHNIVHHEVDVAANGLADAIVDVLRTLLEPIDKRLAEVERSCGLMVDHANFMEKCLVRVTEAAHRPDSPEAEEWRQSLGDDPQSDGGDDE